MSGDEAVPAWRAILAVGVAAVAVAGAVFVLVRPDGAVPPDVPSSVEAVTTTEVPHVGPALDPVWELDSEVVHGRRFAAFRSPTAGLMFDSGQYGVIDGGEVIVTATGLPDPRGYTVDSVELVGIEASDGSVLWSVSPSGIDGCAPRPVRDQVVCFEPYADVPALMAFGLHDGEMRRIPLPEGWFPYAIDSSGDTVLVLEGNPEDGESVLHGGELDELDSAWSTPVTAFAPWEGVDGDLVRTDGDRGLVTVGGDAQFFDVRTGVGLTRLALESDSTVVDSATGEQVWTLPDPDTSGVTRNGHTYTREEASVVRTNDDTGEVTGVWTVPVGDDGFSDSGTLIALESGLYYAGSRILTRVD